MESEKLGIRKTRTAPLNPQSNGLVERYKWTLATQLNLCMSRDQKDWDLQLPLVLLATQSAVQEIINVFIYITCYGRRHLRGYMKGEVMCVQQRGARLSFQTGKKENRAEKAMEIEKD
ncbi:hypothetical protein QQF64_025848 [Cirrhinus molitorella]|uniref:Integrase catalytic domain-containing protein n=1 Tax=Cirrhinus molitorella TaxID=172907 RepID=A0ABR3NRN2_9TELE